MFEQTVESELEDSSGEHETATERYSRARRADVVRDVTPLKCKFLGPRMETKNCNHARRDMEKPRHLPRSLPRVSASDENTLRHCQVAQKTRSGYPRTLWSTPGQMFGPLALLIVAPSFILSVALEGKRLTNRTAATKTTWGSGSSWPWGPFMGHDNEVQ